MGPLEETSPAGASRHFEVNYFGTVRVLRAVLPTMRRQGSGMLIIVGSLGGLIGLPYLSHYCAAKSALDRLVESLRPEVSGFGIGATIVHPGNFKTGFSARHRGGAEIEKDSPYLDAFARRAEFYRHCEECGSMPAALARTIDRLLERKRLPPSLVVGSRLERTGAIAKRLLPARVFEPALRLFYSP